ncbi:esterase FE4 [Culex quinquefasciatus]|uniref:Esterase FE4 n=1 Tax=Culex quinquefasciatus TaxID=7176 RepID=B0X0I3_CULQU|nr:venom carboxylesterase-6 [Culex quinquefasciatus]EDS38144.1 esterase FE4 [Culex quinquefasciatus]|eukprot:XP_001863155.1 esterase FE4 [Culex quinquefasciatus]
MHRSTLAALLAIATAAVIQLVLAAIGDRYAFERVLPEPRTCIQDGCIQGRFFDGLEGDQYEGYLGVPFAKPPVGKLRFKNPVRNHPWSGDYDATWERSRCLQKNDLRPNQTVQGSEDCLYLNVFRPRNVTGPLPVIFYIHGGGYASGSNSMAEFGPERFMDMKKVILVIPQYRLGVFGFLSTEDRISPGNYGLKDQLFALRWTQRNIAYFGGDPNLVTIVGQSVGGSSVQYHMMSPQSKGLFARAVSMSGSALSFWNYNVNPLVLARRQADAVGIQNVEVMTTKQLVEALREVDGLELAKSIDKLKYFYVHDLTLFHPTVERYVDEETFISEDPRDLWAAGRYHKVPYTMGFVPNEAAFASAILLTNKTLLNELNENSSKYIPRIVGVYNPTSVQMLKDRFFPDGTNERWLTEKNVGNLQDLFSEAFIKHGIELSVKQAAFAKAQSSPLSVYYFNIKGPYSHSYYYTYTYGDFGIVHIDDLMYLFRSTGLYPDFERGTPAWYASKVFVDYFINIAYDGIVGPPCTAESCEILEFTNYNEVDSPGYLKVIDRFDEEKFAFWYNLYAMQNY